MFGYFFSIIKIFCNEKDSFGALLCRYDPLGIC